MTGVVRAGRGLAGRSRPALALRKRGKFPGDEFKRRRRIEIPGNGERDVGRVEMARVVGAEREAVQRGEAFE